MKRISALLLGLLLIGVFTLPAWAAGALTTNKFLYKPSLGARGETEKITFDAGLDRIDARLGKEIWVGDPDYGTTLQDAITAIGTTNKTILRIPAGAWAITSSLIVPANITLKFEEGAYLDLSALKDAAIEGLSSAAACVVTWNNHGLQTGDYVRPYGIRQLYLSGATHTAEWMNLNDNVYPITKINDNSFSIAFNTSTHHAYVPSTDPGRLCVPLIIKGKIEAGKQKIFQITAPAHICRGTGAGDLVAAAQTDFYPEWFGAVGNGVTDDLLALNACLKAMVIGTYVRGTMHLSTWYAVSDTFSINELNPSNSIGHILGSGRKNSGFIGLISCAGKPIMEMVGTGWIRLKNFGFTGVNANPGAMPADAPSVAILLGRSNFNTNGGGSWFEDLGFWGWYQYGLVFNYGYATSTWLNLESYGFSMSNANNHWMFNMYFGAGHVTNPFPALVPTNSSFESFTGFNASADGNRLFNSYFARYAATTGLAGNAGIYLNNSNVLIDAVACGGLYDYAVYALNSEVDMRNAGADGYGDIAGVYVCSDATATGYPNCTRKVSLENVVNAKANGVVLMTDSYTSLTYSKVSKVAGSNGCKIQLGAGAQYSRFDRLDGITEFSAVGSLVGCDVELPLSCSNFSIALGGYDNHIKRIMYNGNFQWLDGDVHFGQPGWTAPDVYYGPYKMVWAAAAPSTGSWAQGSVIHKSGAAAGASPGWICNLDNTFGTLNGGATTGSITGGAKLLTVNSVTGLTIGNFIDVVADGGGNAVTAGRIVNIDSTNKIVTLAANAGATATGTAVSFHNHTTAEAFSPMAPTGARTSGVTAAATSPITVTHGLGTTPTKVLLTSVDGVPTGIFPNALGTTTFAINFAGGGSHAFYWEVIQ